MDCREARERLNEELDGRLAPDAAARLAEHVAGCSACAQERRDLASLRATFRAMPRVAAPLGFKEDVMSALPRGRVRRFPRSAGWIAAVAAVLVLTVTFLQSGRGVVERDVASAPESRARVEREEAGAPAPEFAAKSVEPVVPPRPVSPPRSDASEPRDAVPGDTPAAEENRRKTGEGFAKGSEQDAGGAAGPAPAPPPAVSGTPAAPPAPDPSAAGNLLELTGRETAENVRYVVFRDAAAAQKFAADLAAAQTPLAKDKARDADAAKELAQGAGGIAAEPDAKKKLDDASDLMRQAAFRTRRVIARTPLAGPLHDAELAASASAVGGELLPVAATKRFTELLDAPPAPAEKAERAAEDERKAQPAEPPAGGGKAAPAKPAGRRAPPPVVVVIVVLEETAKPPAEKR